MKIKDLIIALENIPDKEGTVTIPSYDNINGNIPHTWDFFVKTFSYSNGAMLCPREEEEEKSK